MALPVITLRIDTSGTAFRGSPTWTNATSSLLTGEDGGPVSITWGRQDEHSEVSPSQCSFLLDNATGAWTPGNAAAPAAWDSDCRVNVRVTVGGTTYDRFDGYVDSIEPTWPGGVQSWSVVRVSCSDLTARLARQAPLRPMSLEEVFLDSPAYLYQLTEAEGAVSAGNSGSVATASSLVPVASKYGVGDFTFGQGTGIPTDGMSTLMVNRILTSLSADDLKGDRLEGTLGAVSADLFSAEAWFVADPGLTAPLGRAVISTLPGYTPLMQVVSSGGQLLWALALTTSGGQVRCALVTQDDGAGLYTIWFGTGNVADGLLHHVLVTNDSTGSLFIYLDGVAVLGPIAGITTLGALPAARLVVGQRLVNGLPAGPAFRGTLQNLAIYPAALSAARALAHYTAGKTAYLGESSDARYARIAAYRNVPTSGLPSGVAVMGAQQLDGQTVTDALNEVARTEGGVSYTTGAGALTFTARTARYNAAIGVTFTAESLDPALSVRRDNQGLINRLAVQRVGGASQDVLDQASIDQRGTYDGGSITVAPSTDADALQNASWIVTTNKSPKTRLPSAKVDLLTEPVTATVQAVLAATIGTRSRVTALPSQAPAATFTGFVEGGTDTIGVGEWTVEFFTSPDLPAVLTLDDPTLGVLDSSNLIAF